MSDDAADRMRRASGAIEIRDAYNRPPERSGGDFLSSLTDAVQRNPVPAAMIGMGALWLFMGGSRVSLFGGLSRGVHLAGSAAGSAYDAASWTAGSAYDAASSATGAAYDMAARTGSAAAAGGGSVLSGLAHVGAQAAEAASAAASTIGQEIGATVARTTDALASTGQVIGATASLAGSAASQGGQQVAQRMSDFSGNAAETGAAWSRTAQQSLGDLLERQPLVLGAVGIAIGAGIAASLPISKLEQDAMGEARDKVASNLQNTLSETMDRAGQKAEHLMHEAEKQGLTPEALGNTIRDTTDKMSSFASAASDTFRKQLDEKSK